MDTQMWDLVEQLVIIILTTVVTVVGPVLAIEARKLSAIWQANLQASMSADEWNLMVTLSETAVRSAQQMGIIGQLENIGRVKKAWALAAVQNALNARGVFIDVNEVSAAIEAAYNATFGEGNA